VTGGKKRTLKNGAGVEKRPQKNVGVAGEKLNFKGAVFSTKTGGGAKYYQTFSKENSREKRIGPRHAQGAQAPLKKKMETRGGKSESIGRGGEIP